MTVNKFGSHIAKKHSRYRKNYYPFSAIKSEQHIDANNLRIVNVANPVASSDGVNKLYADFLAHFYTKLKNWPGNYIDGAGKRLVNIALPIDLYDVVNKEYVCANTLTVTGTTFDARNKRISKVGDPREEEDVVTLGYLKRILKF